MTEKKSVTVTIYKNEYTLKGEAEPQHIIDLAKYVDTKMTEMGRKSSAPADKIAILAAMNIADDLRRLEKANEENIKLIESLEKNFEEIKTVSDATIKNAAIQNEETAQVRINLSQEKEKFQALHHQKTQAEQQVADLKKQVENLSGEMEKLKSSFNSNQNTTHDLQQALEIQKKLTDDAETESRKLKNQVESLDSELAQTKEALEKTEEATTTPQPAHHGTALSDEKLLSLVKKIEAVLE